MVTWSQLPASQPATVQQVIQGGHWLAVVNDPEILTEGQNAMHHLPGPLRGGRKLPAVASLVQHPGDPRAELSGRNRVSWSRRNRLLSRPTTAAGQLEADQQGQRKKASSLR